MKRIAIVVILMMALVTIVVMEFDVIGLQNRSNSEIIRVLAEAKGVNNGGTINCDMYDHSCFSARLHEITDNVTECWDEEVYMTDIYNDIEPFDIVLTVTKGINNIGDKSKEYLVGVVFE